MEDKIEEPDASDQDCAGEEARDGDGEREAMRVLLSRSGGSVDHSV